MLQQHRNHASDPPSPELGHRTLARELGDAAEAQGRQWRRKEPPGMLTWPTASLAQGKVLLGSDSLELPSKAAWLGQG